MHFRVTVDGRRRPPGTIPAAACYPRQEEAGMLKVLLWIVGIIFLIGLLVVIGVFDLIF